MTIRHDQSLRSGCPICGSPLITTATAEDASRFTTTCRYIFLCGGVYTGTRISPEVVDVCPRSDPFQEAKGKQQSTRMTQEQIDRCRELCDEIVGLGIEELFINPILGTLIIRELLLKREQL